ncbi:acetylglutamate kinase [Sporosarcina saromensis]|uniref:Acetylglutamate kinase n=1 Tax=Sporosarcina saromensis TaxID=359365 RepID=A0ABU4G8Y3_9BACL|nr:acetylglutamate kinase [Sporosarcina saromensis]MDW0112042.1 acetylglutamate kinase [Sporosarcina saromensis]
MTTSKSTHHIARKRIVIKLGGSMLEGLCTTFFEQFHQLQQDGYDVVIVHGGGPSINAALANAGIESKIDNGLRVTCEKSSDVIKHVLISDVNTALVFQLNKEGIPAIGLSGFDGKLLTCSLLDEARYGLVGKIEKVNAHLLDTLLKAGILPVVSCIGASAEGKALNINADTVASEVALAIGAKSLMLVTDTPGIHVGNAKQHAATPLLLAKWITEGAIYGGMIPKVEAALTCLEAGIPAVHIVDQQLEGTVIEIEEVFS